MYSHVKTCPGGRRNWVQVLSNGIMGCAACFGLFWTTRELLPNESLFSNHGSTSWGVDGIGVSFAEHYWPSFWICALVAHYACCNGDTWASEVRSLARLLLLSQVSD